MQGVILNEKGEFVKAAIVNIKKARESEGGNEQDIYTYTRSDESGKFFIQDLDPAEEYIIEIHLEDSNSDTETGYPAEVQKKEDIIMNTESANVMYIKPNHDIRDKLYQIRNNTWW